MATWRMGEEKAGHGHGCLECTRANPGDSQAIPLLAPTAVRRL